MTRKCSKCDAEYTARQFSFDSGFCKNCKPGFWQRPLWLESSPAGTRDLWRQLIAVHVCFLFIFPLLLDNGEISIPGTCYTLAALAYLLARYLVAKLKGFPTLSKRQAATMAALPLYGPVAFLVLFYFVQRLRYGN